MAKRNFPQSEPGRVVEVPEGLKALMLVTDGWARVKYIEPQMKQSSNENDQVLAWATFLDGDLVGYAILQSWTMVDQSMWRLKNDMRMCGAIDDLEVGKPFDLEDDEILERVNGMEGNAIFETDDSYMNKLRSKIVFHIDDADAADYPPVKLIVKGGTEEGGEAENEW